MTTGGTSAQPSSRPESTGAAARVERVDREIHFGATLVVSVADSPAQALTDEARALGWPLIAARRPGDVLRAMWRAPALLVSLVHVAQHEPALADDAAEIVRGVRSRRPELPLIGVSPMHAASLERRLREAG